MSVWVGWRIGQNSSTFTPRSAASAAIAAGTTKAAGAPEALNCQAALAALEEEGIQPVASDLGGARGRTVHFDTGTGEVLVRRLTPLPPPEGGVDPGRCVKDRKGRE